VCPVRKPGKTFLFVLENQPGQDFDGNVSGRNFKIAFCGCDLKA